ncbi:MAG: hypothetical protein ACJ0A3_01070 [Dehalococcoidia bacterium]
MTTNKEQTKAARYQVSTSLANEQNRSLPTLLTSRLDYVTQGGVDQNPSADSDIAPILDLLANVSSTKDDYLLPDTPLKEAIFRVILANKNKPMSANEISEQLSNRWSESTNSRNISANVIERLLTNSQTYCISATN